MTAQTATYDVIVNKSDLRQLTIEPGPDEEAIALEPGQILARLDRFALTANNVTYGVVGDSFGYWKFFPVSRPGWGRIPVWGFADVVRSENPEVRAGERLYGFFPMSSHLVIQADRVAPGSLFDGAPHRSGLPAFYNQYLRVEADPSGDPTMENLQAIFRPLFATAFLLDDLLEEHGFYGAGAILIASASSKTSLGLAYLLASDRRSAYEIVALTSPRNAGFAAATGYYDKVTEYVDVSSLDVKPAILIDLSGDPAVVRAVHTHFAAELTLSCRVGSTHWEDRAPARNLPGPEPTFFFAPDRAARRQAELGVPAFRARLRDAQERFLADARRWLRIVEHRGPGSVEPLYRAVLDGKSDPSEGQICKL